MRVVTCVRAAFLVQDNLPQSLHLVPFQTGVIFLARPRRRLPSRTLSTQRTTTQPLYRLSLQAASEVAGGGTSLRARTITVGRGGGAVICPPTLPGLPRGVPSALFRLSSAPLTLNHSKLCWGAHSLRQCPAQRPRRIVTQRKLGQVGSQTLRRPLGQPWQPPGGVPTRGPRKKVRGGREERGCSRQRERAMRKPEPDSRAVVPPRGDAATRQLYLGRLGLRPAAGQLAVPPRG